MSAKEKTEAKAPRTGEAQEDPASSWVAAASRYAGYIPGVVLLVTVAVGYVYGPALAILVLAVFSLAAAIAMLWESLRAAFGETALTPEEAFSIGAPSVEEEQKRAVLRAIKDLDFEHSVGKISDEDYSNYRARYRREAKRLLRLIDTKAAPERSKVEELVGRRLAAAGLVEVDPRWDAADEDGKKKKKKRKKRKKKSASPKADLVAEVADSPTAASQEAVADAEVDEVIADASPEENLPKPSDSTDQAASSQGGKICPDCSTLNDTDAAFCKTCGSSLTDEEQG